MAVVGSGGVVLLPGEAARVDVGSFDVVVHATGEQTAGAFSLVETAEPETRVGPPLHVHRTAAESFYVLEGEYVMHLDGREFRCPAGSFVHVPAGMTHTFWTSAAPSRKLNLYTPSAMDGYFEEFGAALRDGIGPDGLHEIAERHAMEIVGPIPDSYL